MGYRYVIQKWKEKKIISSDNTYNYDKEKNVPNSCINYFFTVSLHAQREIKISDPEATPELDPLLKKIVPVPVRYIISYMMRTRYGTGTTIFFKETPHGKAVLYPYFIKLQV
jgi:hypothetical protein